MILAFALAINERNIATSDLETAVNESEKRRLQKMVRTATGQSEELRALVMRHFADHGC